MRHILIAESAGRGSSARVVVSFAPGPNQPHRADMARCWSIPGVRRRGIGQRLLAAAEALALTHGRNLLTLDTEAGSAGNQLSGRCGWTPIGSIPKLLPHAGWAADARNLLLQGGSARPMSAIRPATPADLPAILAIYNHAVRETTAIWNWSEVDLANREAWFFGADGTRLLTHPGRRWEGWRSRLCKLW